MASTTVLPPENEGWFKSSFSQNTGACVEIRFANGLTQMRNTRDRSGPMVAFDQVSWEEFLLGVWNDEFRMSA